MENLQKFIDELIKNPIRGNIKYIHPGDNEFGYAKLIAALANDNGGSLILGLMDDGTRIINKGFQFQKPNKEKIKSFLNGYDQFEIKEVNYQGKNLIIIKVEKEHSGVPISEKYYMFKNDYSNQVVEIKQVNIFISYNHLVKELADVIENDLISQFSFRLKINRDTQLKYRDSIEDFMRSIKQNDIIVSLVSNTYLKSEACMYEISELMKDDNYTDKLAFIVFSDHDNSFLTKSVSIKDLVPQVYGSQRFKYTEYWSLKYEEYTDQYKRMNYRTSGTTGLHVTINRIDSILKSVDDFIEMLNRKMGQDFTTMKNNDFLEIHEMISSEFNEKNR